MDRQTFNTLKQEITDKCPECRKHLAALQMLWERTNNGGGESPTIKEAPHSMPGHSKFGRRKGALTACVRYVIGTLGERFNSHDIERVIVANDLINSKIATRVKLGLTLRRLLKNGEIQVVKAGLGRIPADYKKISQGG
jgi:hypothetical protein